MLMPDDDKFSILGTKQPKLYIYSRLNPRSAINKLSQHI